jgi:Xaa-Pro aminopeptidase
MLQNLEFIADSVALENITDKKSYQITLLKVTTQQSCVAITNPFFQSLIKKRIVMLNTNQSKKWNSWKYFIIIPALAAFLLYFQVKVIAQEKQNPSAKSQELTQETVAVLIDKNSTDEQMKSDAEKLKKEHNIKLKFSKIKRNSAGEIVAIKVEYKDVNGATGTTQFNGNEPIKPIQFYKSDDGNIGFGAIQKNMEYAYNFTTDSDDNAQVITIISDEDDAEMPEVPELPEAAESPEVPEAPETIEVPELPTLPRKPGCQEKRVIIKKEGNGKNKIQIVVNGEVMDIDGDKIIAELEPMINSSLYSLDEFRNDLDFKEIGKIKKKAMQEARITMKRVRPEMERAKREIELSRPEMEQARKEMQEAKEELRQARLEIEKSKAELVKLRAESKKTKK